MEPPPWSYHLTTRRLRSEILAGIKVVLREPLERCRGFRWLLTNVGEPIVEGINAALHGSQERCGVNSPEVLQLKTWLGQCFRAMEQSPVRWLAVFGCNWTLSCGI